MSQRRAGRATRQILSGSQLASSRDAIGDHVKPVEPASLAYWYLVALSVLVVLCALVWAIFGMPATSPVLLILAIALIGSWLVL